MTNSKPVSLGSTPLFKPIQVGTHTLNHRVVLAPLTRLRNLEYVPQPQMIEYYDQRSKEPGTLVITEATLINEEAGSYFNAPGIFREEHINKWREIFNKIHENKSIVFQQIWAMGWSSAPDVLATRGLRYVSASTIYPNEDSKAAALSANNPLHSLTIPEIKKYVADFVQAGKNSIEAGADGVEIHGANGYLLNQFLDSRANVRQDEYGVTIQNKCKFMLEVVDGLVEAIGADKVGIRISPFSLYGDMQGILDPEFLAIYAYLLSELEKRAKKGNRLAFVHVVEPRVGDGAKMLNDEEGMEVQGSNEFIYDVWKGNLIRAGAYGSNPNNTINDVSSKRREKTLIAYGRYFISNPDLPKRLKEGLPLAKYKRETFYGSATGYIDYPTYEETNLKSQP